MDRSVIAAAILGASLCAACASAQDVPVEQGTIGRSAVTLHVHPFLSEQELTTLRLVLVNEQALEIFVPNRRRGFAALAVAPDEGFIRDNLPVPSAKAVAGLRDAGAAQSDALEECNTARRGGAPCVIVLEVAPAR